MLFCATAGGINELLLDNTYLCLCLMQENLFTQDILRELRKYLKWLIIFVKTLPSFVANSYSKNSQKSHHFGLYKRVKLIQFLQKLKKLMVSIISM